MWRIRFLFCKKQKKKNRKRFFYVILSEQTHGLNACWCSARVEPQPKLWSGTGKLFWAVWRIKFLFCKKYKQKKSQKVCCSERSEAEGRASLSLRPSSFLLRSEIGLTKMKKKFWRPRRRRTIKSDTFFLRLEICGKMTQLFFQSFCTKKCPYFFFNLFVLKNALKSDPTFFFNLFALKNDPIFFAI